MLESVQMRAHTRPTRLRCRLAGPMRIVVPCPRDHPSVCYLHCLIPHHPCNRSLAKSCGLCRRQGDARRDRSVSCRAQSLDLRLVSPLILQPLDPAQQTLSLMQPAVAKCSILLASLPGPGQNKYQRQTCGQTSSLPAVTPALWYFLRWPEQARRGAFVHNWDYRATISTPICRSALCNKVSDYESPQTACSAAQTVQPKFALSVAGQIRSRQEGMHRLQLFLLGHWHRPQLQRFEAT